MRTYILQVTTEFCVTDAELQRLMTAFDNTPDDRTLVNVTFDVENEPHLLDWRYIVNSQYFNEEDVDPVRPEYVPEMDRVT